VNGTAMDPGEASVFFDSANNANNYTTKTSFSLATDSSGSVYVCNHTADTVYKLTDLNSDEDANDTGEAMEYVSNTGSPTTGPPLARALDRGRDCMVGPAGEIIPVAPPKIGTTASWLLDDPLGGSLPYFTALSFGNAGIPLGSPDIRSIPLSLDVLVYMSVNNLLPWLKNFQGVFHSSGQASVQVALPNNPALVNQTINMAFVTLKASEPSGILTVSNPYSFIIQQ